MEITTRQQSDVLVVDVSGRWDTRSAGEASQRLTEFAERDERKILLNLEQLEFLSSAGLRVILRTAKLLRANAGEMKLCNARALVAEVLHAAGFSKLIHLCDSEAAALEAF